MAKGSVNFRVTKMAATVPEGVPIKWHGKEFNSGPLTIELDESPDSERSQGVLDYSSRQAQAEFHVRLNFPEFAGMLQDSGVDPEMTQPVRAVLRSGGKILEDHGFALSGLCQLRPHGLFSPRNTQAAILPGH